ncbi:MAG TPA: hypothetical protein VK254_03885 [Candidatus Bathyarchaeia archaeon]|nr:hypothetical protein [Candidatus Bathyarchaeia archaeon]
MTDTDKEKLLGTSIAELAEKNNWPTQMRRDMVRVSYPRSEYESETFREENRRVDELAKKTCLKDVLSSLERIYSKYRVPSEFHTSFRTCRKRFVELGLTRLDAIFLPQETVTPEMIKAIPKEKLLQMDARILGTISSTLLGYYRYKDTDYKDLDLEDELLPFPTVAELISKEPHWSFHEEVLTATLRLLWDMGFTYDDGLFFQAGTRQKFIEDLMKEECLVEKAAYLVTRIAEKRGWIKFPA